MKILDFFRPIHQLKLLIATAAIFSAVVMAASVSASLSVDEQQLADALANNQAWQQNRSTQPDHFLGIQTLSIELDERKKTDNQRRARVYQFNYNTQRSRVILVDLITRDLVKTQAIKSIHLPLNDHEIATARTLTEQQPNLMDALNQEQQNRGLPALVDLSQIDVKASIFEPNDQAHVCAKQRCALISLFDQTRTVFSTEPLVNLQRLSVTTLQQSF